MEIQNSHKQTKLVINETEYELTLYLSVKDIMFLVEIDNEASDICHIHLCRQEHMSVVI